MASSALRSNLLYGVGNVSSTAALFLLVPYFVNRLTPDEYGAWALFEVAILFLNMLIVSGTDVGLMRQYWLMDADAERADLLGTVIIAVSSWGGVIFVAGLGLALTILADFPGGAFSSIWAAAAAWAESVFALMLTVFRIREMAGTFITLSFGRTILFSLFSVLLVEHGYGISGAIAGRLIGVAAILGVAILIAAPFIRMRVDLKLLSKTLRFGFPLLPANILTYVLHASDRYVVQYFAGLQSVAVYSFAYKIASAVDILVSRPFALDWGPRRFQIAMHPDAASKYARTTIVFATVAITVALFIRAVVDDLYELIAPAAYLDGRPLVPLLLAAYVVFGLSYPLNVGIMVRDRTRLLPVIAGLAAIVCVGLNLLLIPKFGLRGAAWSTFIGYAIWTVGVAYGSLRLYSVPYPFGQFGWLMASALLAYLGIVQIESAVQSGVGHLAVVLKCGWVASIMSVFLWWVRASSDRLVAGRL